jgi:hypothetical protein
MYDYDGNITPRSKGDKWEDFYTDMNYSNYKKGDGGGNKFYYRAVGTRTNGQLIVLRIPKTISQEMPNASSFSPNITGILKTKDLIEVKSMERE